MLDLIGQLIDVIGCETSVAHVEFHPQYFRSTGLTPR